MSLFHRKPPSEHTPPTLMDRALGAFLGVAIGDALGATVEFCTASEIAARYKVHKDIIGGGWLQLKPGRVTDDTEMALALGAAIVACGRWDLPAIAESYALWMRSKPIDIGNTCRRGIRRYLADGSLCAPACESDGGNGAAMRNVATVLATLGDENLLIQRSLEQAHITHNQSQSDAATAAIACMTRQLILGSGREHCERIARDLVQRHPAFQFQPWPRNTTGYIVDTVQTVFDAFFNTSSFEECLIRVVNRGGDADTTGALAGQLAGALYGQHSIPARWLKKLDSSVATAIHQQTSQLLRLGSVPSVSKRVHPVHAVHSMDLMDAMDPGCSSPPPNS